MVYSSCSYWQLEWCQWSSVVDGNVHPAVSHMSPDSPPLWSCTCANLKPLLCIIIPIIYHHCGCIVLTPIYFPIVIMKPVWHHFAHYRSSHPYPYISHICRSWQTSKNHKPPIFSNLIIYAREKFERLGIYKNSVLGFVTTGGVSKTLQNNLE